MTCEMFLELNTGPNRKTFMTLTNAEKAASERHHGECASCNEAMRKMADEAWERKTKGLALLLAHIQATAAAMSIRMRQDEEAK